MVRFGPAGSCLANIEGLKKIHKSGLRAIEIEFTYGVWMENSLAEEIGKLAGELDISLSVHAPYYINLASLESDKIQASKKRILESCQKAEVMGAKYVVFHPGFYQNRPPEDIYTIIKNEIKELMSVLKRNKWKVELAPETTGKRSQFGDLEELLKLREETGSALCVDFAHLLARSGNIDYDNVFRKLKKIKHIHAHFSGIKYSEKGEIKHLITSQSVILPLIKEVVKRKVDITIINESPEPYKDSLKMLKAYKQAVGYKKKAPSKIR